MSLILVFCVACLAGMIGAGIVMLLGRGRASIADDASLDVIPTCETALYRDGVWIGGSPIGHSFFRNLSTTIENHAPELKVEAYPREGETLILTNKSSAKVMLFSEVGLDKVVTTLPWDGSALAPSTTDILRNIPALIWSTHGDKCVRLVNAETAHMVEEAKVETPTALFPQLPTQIPGGGPVHHRIAYRENDESRVTWYDIASFQRGPDQIHIASNADSQVVAERARTSVVQALTKTFAHLSVGLAVFDKDGRLILFNPALTQMVGLPISFLSGRPSLYAFLDQLRQEGTLPEPKDYKVWRRALVARLTDKSANPWIDTWTLPDGLTFRVTGRPQTDQSIVFVVEDISAETTLTRRFREDVELAQIAMDSSDDAVAVFENGGGLSISNRRFDEIWQVDSNAVNAPSSILDIARQWHKLCEPSPVLGDLTNTLSDGTETRDWSDVVQLKTGEWLQLTVCEVSNRHTLVRFATHDELVVPA